jgi:sterol desaturase/sphingolipid hydroxylase (fatty acid hydroxylase superfamily)
MLTLLLVGLKLTFCLFLADLISGIGHWIEDRYFHSELNIVGPLLAIPNLMHHTNPRGFLKGSYWNRNGIPITIGLVLIPLFWAVSWLSIYSFLTIILLSQSNEIHACAHRSDKENTRLIKWFQKIGLLQSRRHHGYHHRAPYDCRYCILTDFLNPVLDRLLFWSVLEKGMAYLGVHPTD